MLQALAELKEKILTEPEAAPQEPPEKLDAPDEEAKETSAESPESTEESNPNEQREKVIIDGKEHEVSISDLKKDYQLKQASYKKLQEAAEMRKQADSVRKEAEELKRTSSETIETVEKALNDNTIPFLKEYFGDKYDEIADVIAKDRTAHHQKLLNMTPEQKVEHEYEKKLAAEKASRAELENKWKERDSLENQREKESFIKQTTLEFDNLKEKYPYVEEIISDARNIIAWQVSQSDDENVTIESEYKKLAEKLSPRKKEKFDNARKNESTNKSLNSAKNTPVPKQAPDYSKMSIRERIAAMKEEILKG